MFSLPGRIATALLTTAGAVLLIAAFASHDDLAGVAIYFLAIYYVLALAVVLVVDYVATAMVKSTRAVRRAKDA